MTRFLITIAKILIMKFGVSATVVAEAPQVQHYAKHHDFSAVTEEAQILLG